MTRLVSASVALLVLFFANAVVADNDYFTAHENSRLQVYLSSMEQNHGNKVLPLIAKGRYNDAMEELKYVLDRFPNHPRYLMMVRAVEQFTKTSLAIPYFERSLKLYPQYALTHAQFGWYFVETGRIELGITRLQHAVELDPKLTIAYVWLARAYLKAGNQELAKKAAAQAKDLGYNESDVLEPRDTKAPK